MRGSSPLTLTLDLSRAASAERPYDFVFAPQSYRLHSPGGSIKDATFPWDEPLFADLTAIRKSGRDPVVVQRLGGRLREFLAPTQWPVLETKLLDAVRQHQRVVVRIRAAAAEIYALPWELLTIEASGQHVGELPDVLVRYEWPDTETVPPRAASGWGRILLAWSGRVPAADHLAAIIGACGPAGHAFDPDRDVLGDASCGRLAHALDAATTEGAPVSILHLLCHGTVAGSTFGLALDDDEAPGRTIAVDAGRLRQILAPHAATLRLVVLAACDSGNDGALGNQMGSVAQNLHRAGIAAVVASRFPLSVSGSKRLARTLYPALLTGPAARGPAAPSLEDAFLATRRYLAEDARQLDWASLQLYARDDTPTTWPASSAPLETLRAPAVREELSQFRAVFRGTRAQIALLGRYKALHDLLQELEVPCNVIVRAQKRLLAARDAWDELRDPLDSLQMLVEAADKLLAGERLRDEFETSRRRLAEAGALLAAALAGDSAKLPPATFHIQRVLNVESSSANNRLLTTARELRLGDVVAALRSVLDNLRHPRAAGSSTASIDELARLVASIGELHTRLEALVQEHDQWQGIGNELRLLVGNDRIGVDEAQMSWPLIQTGLAAVLAASATADWARVVGAEADKLDRELASSAQAAPSASCLAGFRGLWRRCNQRFVDVDRQLLRTCEELQRVGETLDSVLTVIG